MNSRHEITSRLLGLFPKQVIARAFGGKKAKKDELLTDIARGLEEQDILNFVHDNIDFTRQHVYFFTHDIRKLGDLPTKLVSGKLGLVQGDGIIVEYFGLYDVSYTVFLQDPYEPVSLLFKCPLRLILNKDLLGIHFTILEKNLQSYFGDRKVLTTRRAIEEKDIIDLVVNELGKHGTINSCDLNKGIKELWDHDYIDALEIQYRKDRSTSKEVMDEEYTFKQQYPELYKEAMLMPLVKVLFKFLVDRDKYCNHFVIEPTLGKITFPVSPKEKEHNLNVIRKILEFN